MDIWIGSLLEGAAQARGAVAVIDVFRAFTTAAVVLANGASRIIMVGAVAEALALRSRGAGSICMGEVGGRIPAGFDFDNSPHAVLTRDFTGKTVIQRTSAGTQGIVTVRAARHLFAAALVTVSATARSLLAAEAERISLVAMGVEGVRRSDEDELCALHLRNLLEGRLGDPQAVRQTIMASGDAMRFGDPERPHFNRHDLEIALDIDRYDFAIQVAVEDGNPIASRA